MSGAGFVLAREQWEGSRKHETELGQTATYEINIAVHIAGPIQEHLIINAGAADTYQQFRNAISNTEGRDSSSDLRRWT